MASPSASTLSIVPVSIVLRAPNDWDEWHEVLSVKARGLSVWDYINEVGTADLTEPTELIPNDVKPSANATPTPFSGLDPDQLEEYRNRQRKYERDIRIYDRRVAAIETIRAYIFASVAREHVTFLLDQPTPRAMIKNLSLRFSPTAEYRERQLEILFAKLRDRRPDGHSWEAILVEWERAYATGKKAGFADTTGTRCQRLFLTTIERFLPDFSAYWRNKILDGTNIDFYALVQKAREYQALSLIDHTHSVSSSSAYSTTSNTSNGPRPSLQGRDSNGDKVYGDCLCGEPHRFKDCPYLMRKARTTGWKPDPMIQTKIDDKLAINDSLRRAVELCQRHDTPETPTNPETEPTLQIPSGA